MADEQIQSSQGQGSPPSPSPEDKSDSGDSSEAHSLERKTEKFDRTIRLISDIQKARAPQDQIKKMRKVDAWGHRKTEAYSSPLEDFQERLSIDHMPSLPRSDHKQPRVNAGLDGAERHSRVVTEKTETEADPGFSYESEAQGSKEEPTDWQQKAKTAQRVALTAAEMAELFGGQYGELAAEELRAAAGIAGEAGKAKDSRTGSNIAGGLAAWRAKDKHKMSGSRSAALGGAIAGGIHGLASGEGVGGAAKEAGNTALNWWVLGICFGALFTLAGSVPAFLYLNLHYILAQKKVKIGAIQFLPMSFSQKWTFIGVDLAAFLVIAGSIAVPLGTCYAVKQDTLGNAALKIYSFVSPIAALCDKINFPGGGASPAPAAQTNFSGGVSSSGCQVNQGICKPDTLKQEGDKYGCNWDPTLMSRICSHESGGTPQMSGTDRCNVRLDLPDLQGQAKGYLSWSGGLWQVDIFTATSSRFPKCAGLVEAKVKTPDESCAGGKCSGFISSKGSCVPGHWHADKRFCDLRECGFKIGVGVQQYQACLNQLLGREQEGTDMQYQFACEKYNGAIKSGKSGYSPWPDSYDSCKVI